MKQKHGLEGFGVIIKLFQKIYSNGYYLEWLEDEQLLFSKKNNVNINTINEYINVAIKRDIFHKELFVKYHVLTSRGIQKRFLEVAKRRKQVEFIENFCLIDFEASEYYKDLKERIVFVNENGVNVNNNASNNDIDVSNNLENVDKSTQSKVKESKVKKSREDNIIEIYNLNCSNLPQVKKITTDRRKAIGKFLKEFTEKQFEEVCRKANTNNFLTGKNDRGWKADFDFLIRINKATSILEGKYENSSENNNKTLNYEDLV